MLFIIREAEERLLGRNQSLWCFTGGSLVNSLHASTGDVGSVLGLGRSPGEGNGDPLQYSCLGNPMDRRTWWAVVHGVEKSQTQLCD